MIQEHASFKNRWHFRVWTGRIWTKDLPYNQACLGTEDPVYVPETASFQMACALA